MITSNYAIFGRKYAKDLLLNLIAYYTFDLVTTDSIGNNDGTEVGTLSYGTGIINNRVLATSANYISIANSVDFNFTNGTDIPFSISFWHNKNDAQLRNIMNKVSSTLGYEWAVELVGGLNGPLRLRLYTDATNDIEFSGIMPETLNDIWYNYVITFNGATCKMYHNSVLVTPSETETGTYVGMSVGTASIRIGSSILSSGGGTRIDELAIWKNRVLNQQEINQLYNSGSGITYPLNV